MHCDKTRKRKPAAVQTAFDFGRMKKFFALHPKPRIGVDHLHDVEIGEIQRDKYAIASEGVFRLPFACPEWLKIAGSRTGAEQLLLSSLLHCHYVSGKIVCTHGAWLIGLALEVLPADTKVTVFLHTKRMTRKQIDQLNAADLLKTAASVPEAGHVNETRDALKQAMNLPQTKDMFCVLTDEKLNKLVGGRSRNAFRQGKDKDNDNE